MTWTSADPERAIIQAYLVGHTPRKIEPAGSGDIFFLVTMLRQDGFTVVRPPCLPGTKSKFPFQIDGAKYTHEQFIEFVNDWRSKRNLEPLTPKHQQPLVLDKPHSYPSLAWSAPMKLEITYCHKCGCTHDFGKHVSAPPAVAKTVVKPFVAEVTLKASAPLTAAPASVAKAVETNITVLQPKPAPEKTFNKNLYQALYMQDRREADDLGFGKSGINPMTVKQFRSWRASQPEQQKAG